MAYTLPLVVGTYVALVEHGGLSAWQVGTVTAQGRAAIHRVRPDEIPEGAMIQPVRWSDRGLVAKDQSPWAHVAPAPWTSGIPCCNRLGMAPVLTPQCDGSRDAETVCRSSPRVPPQACTDRLAELMASGVAWSTAMAAVADLSGTTDQAFCDACGAAVRLTPAALGPDRIGMWHTLREASGTRLVKPDGRRRRT